ncbi:MAG: carboxypeptidase-like regulatory domain-containing protein [Firmicutes bacterium]|nr:carboxypeptidase-like regulatory domain-containing protein [Bacillota bacterium]
MLRKPVFLILAAVFLCIFALQGCGGGDSGSGSTSETGAIEGTVVDENGSPIEGALCELTAVDSSKSDDSAKPGFSTTTDANGYYTITKVPVGNYNLSISSTGYNPVQQALNIVGGRTSTQPTITLPPAAYGSLSGTVKSSAAGTPVIANAAINVYTGENVSSTQTDSQGKYQYAQVTEGSHTITAAASGFVSYTGSITIIKDTANVKDISMDPSPTQSPTPSPGYGNVSGFVKDTTGLPVEGVSVTLQKGFSQTTDSNGSYLVTNLEPGIRTLSYAKSGYQSKTQSVTVEANTTVTTPEIILTASTETDVTTWVSRRTNLPEVNNAYGPDVSMNGEKVVFYTSGNVISTWSNPEETIQIYVWDKQTGTITRVSNKASGSTAGANGTSMKCRISGNGQFVVFQSEATDLLPDGLAANSIADIYIVRLSDLAIRRVSNDAGNPNKPGNCGSLIPDINGDGTGVVFASVATNLDTVAPINNNNYAHIYYCKITDMNPSVCRMLDMQVVNGVPVEGDSEGSDPNSGDPAISYDGNFVAYVSEATNICKNNPVTTATNVFRCSLNEDPASGWNIYVTRHDGADLDGSATTQNPAINADGSAIAFECDANLFTTNSNNHILLWRLGSQKLTLVSRQLTETTMSYTDAQIDNAGRYVSFLATGEEKGKNRLSATSSGQIKGDDLNIHGMVYIKDTQANDNNYTLGFIGASGQLPEKKCGSFAMSPDGSYLVFSTKAKNLTGDAFTENVSDVFIRKWK